MSDIGIIGYGFVGKAIANGFNTEKNNIKFYDKYVPSDSLKDVVESSEFIFICLPTPSKPDRIDLSIIDENLEEIAKLANGTDKIIILKSTIVPGTAKNYAEKYPKCNFCSNPEFLTEANSFDDFINTDRHIIGSDDENIRKRVIDLYKNRFLDVPIFSTDLKTAEMVKYMSNCFLATKVIFANEIYDLCKKLGIDYDEVKKMVIADKRIGKTHLNVTEERGFGGKCFVKDLAAMIGCFKAHGIDSSVLETVWQKNLDIRKSRDWEEIPFVMSKD